LENRTEVDDYFELTVRGLPESWISAYAPVVHLAAGERKVVEISVRPPDAPQTQAGRYPFTIRARSQENPEQMDEASAVLTVGAYQSEGRIGILLESTQFSVAPGGSVTVPVVLTNQGLSEDRLRISVEGIPSTWVASPAATVELAPGAEQRFNLTIQPPAAPSSRAGRHKFTLRVTSEEDPAQFAEAECLLTIAAYAQFRSELIPTRIQPGEPALVTVWNEGNFQDSYNLSWWSEGDELIFDPIQVEDLRVPPGESASARFVAAPRARPWIGGEFRYPFTVVVESGEREQRTHAGEVITRGAIPVWVIPIFAVVCLALLCTTALIFGRQRFAVNSATQTAAFNQTAAAQIGEEDTDGDGLTNDREIELGTDPENPDSDGDGLLDGNEVERGTDPLNPDTDGDGLSDGDEVQRGTDPLNPDTDGDGLSDGDEVQRGTDPLNPDSDGDGLPDGEEVRLGTNPLNPDTDGDGVADGDEVRRDLDPLRRDTDRDGLDDGDEVAIGSDPRNPDTDGDGIVDGIDPDPLDPANPSLTATAVPGAPPTQTPSPTVEPGTPTPTAPPPATDTPPPPATVTAQPATPAPLNGDIVFDSNRDGNREIYVLDARQGNVTRLTNDPGNDTHPVWSPNGSRIAFTTNRDGNNEIYLMNADGTGLANLTNNGASDRYPTWSPDGEWLAFTTNRDGNDEIYVMRTDGSELSNISNNPASDTQPDWFSTGVIILTETKIAFTSDRDGNLEIYLMNADGSEQTNLTGSPAGDAFPAASPGGARIAFTTDRDGNQEIYAMGTNGSSPTNLTNNPAQDWQPAWSPLGEHLAFVTNRDGNQEIYAMLNDGSNPFNLTNNAAEDIEPTWRE
jgi:Tol biopolymer transport system component